MYISSNTFECCSHCCSRTVRARWCSRCECTWNFRQFFDGVCTRIIRLSECFKCHAHHHRKAVVTLFSSQSCSLPFRTEIDEKRTWKAQHTTLMHTHITNTRLNSALSLAVYLLPKNIEIIKKFLVVA